MFSDFQQEKLSCNTDIEMPFCIQLPLLTIPIKCCWKKCADDRKKTFVMYVDIKLQNICSKQVLVCSMVFGGSPLNTLKVLLAKCFIIFYQRTGKMYFLSFQKKIN